MPPVNSQYALPTPPAGTVAQPANPNAMFMPGTPATPATAADITPQVPTTQPTIPTSTLTSTPTINLPATAPNTSAPAIATNVAAASALTANQSALLGATDQNEQNAQTNYTNSQNSVTGLINQYLNEGADEQQQLNAAGVPQLLQTSNNLTTQYNTAQASYNAQYDAIMNAPGGTLDEKNAQITALQGQHAIGLATISAQQAIAQNDYTTASTVIQNAIQIKYAPIQDAITYGMQFLSNNKDILTTQQQNEFSANLAVQQQQYTQGTYYAQLNAQTGISMVQTAAANGADQTTLNAMSEAATSGGTIADVAAQANGFLQTGDYTVTQTGIDQNTGLPIYSRINQKTGSLEPLNYNNALGATGSTDTVVNGYQMGASTTMGAYASNTTTQVNNIKATVAKISATVGSVTDVASATAALAAVAPKSPITGDMVMAAAQQYNVDPATLIGVMQAETQCGTDGSKGAQECNWGNVGNTDGLMASGKSVAMTPQQGVDSVAKNLAERAVQTGQNDPAQPTSTQPLTAMQKAQVQIKALPTLLQPSVQTLPDGTNFINEALIPPNMEAMAYAQAAQAGIKILTADQVTEVNTLKTALNHIVNVTAPAWQQIAPSSINDEFLKSATRTTQQSFGIDSDEYSNNKAWADNQESILAQIKGIGGTVTDPSVAAAIQALPTNAGYFAFGQQYDTLKDGNEKIQRSVDILNSSIQTLVPNYKGLSLQNGTTTTPPAGTISNIGGYQIKINADGSSTIIGSN
jgi:hypothetical protein